MTLHPCPIKGKYQVSKWPLKTRLTCCFYLSAIFLEELKAVVKLALISAFAFTHVSFLFLLSLPELGFIPQRLLNTAFYFCQTIDTQMENTEYHMNQMV